MQTSEVRVNLDGWYKKLEQEVAALHATDPLQHGHRTTLDEYEGRYKASEEKNVRLQKLVQAQQRLMDQLRIENEKLRRALLKRHGKIDEDPQG